ncbi:MAG: hypothetical protein KF842_11640 [Caulobacter sp.]|nr:hypothetical protein [Caulobacter sp.]
MRGVMMGLAASVLLLAGVGASAQEAGVDEIVVTGTRISDYDANSTPHVVLVKRADNLIILVNVVCDTRDASQRRDELRATLKALIRAAEKDPAIDLGVGEEVVGRFDESMIDSLIGPMSKPDTSAARLLIKTRVTATDTLDSATGRINAFIKKTPKVGRTEVLAIGDWNLTLIRPEQYRGEVIDLVAKDALASAKAFGDDYGVTVQGLQLPISWYQSGPLDLALYIPYRLEVTRK